MALSDEQIELVRAYLEHKNDYYAKQIEYIAVNSGQFYDVDIDETNNSVVALACEVYRLRSALTALLESDESSL